VTVEASTAIAALLAGPARPARVLGASATAAYLAVDGNEVIAVVAAGGVRLPIALAVAGDVPVAGAPEAARVGGGEVDLGGPRVRPSRWFDPRPRLRGPALRERVAGAQALLAALPAGAVGLDPVPAAAAAAGLAGGDAGPALGLLGRGPGLTPAGDDVVAGALAALALLGAPDPAAVRAVLDAVAGATTLLSAALLRCAARGQVPPQAARLLRALCGGGPVGPALDALLAVGATSGAALALGICAAAEVAATPATAMPLMAEPVTEAGSAAEDVMHGNGVTSPPGPGTPGRR
jgi:hypothetical protein